MCYKDHFTEQEIIYIESGAYSLLSNDSRSKLTNLGKEFIFDIISEDAFDGNQESSDGCSGNYVFFNAFFSCLKKIPTYKIPTACVAAIDKGIVMMYNPGFMIKHTPMEARFIICHEILHIVHSHLDRIGLRNPELLNIATDAIINEIIYNSLDKRCLTINGIPDRRPEKKISIPLGCINIDARYSGLKISEDYYYWMLEQKDIMDEFNKRKENKLKSLFGSKGGGGKSKGNTSSSDGDTEKGDYDNGDFRSNGDIKSNGGVIDEHDIDLGQFAEELGKAGIKNYRSLSEEERKEMTDKILSDLKNRGLMSGDMESSLGLLRKTKKNYIKEISKSVIQLIGKNKSKSYKRENRYGFEGIKGNIKYCNQINVLLDTSGSMCGEFEKALSTIFNRDVVCNIIMCDTVIHGVTQIKNKYELQKITLKGMGGTELMPGVNYISCNKDLNKLNTLILTDGYCDTLNIDNLTGDVLVLSTGIAVEFNGRKKGKNIFIDKSVHV